jgi:Peptidase family S41
MVLKIFSLLAVILLFSCSNYPTDTSGRDLYEMESVWQYLMTYCIWQDTLWHDTLPADAFEFDTPEKIMANVHDTLHGNDYTTYYNSGGGLLQSKDNATGANALASGMVYWDSLADSTGYLLINNEFTKDTYASFLNAVTMVQKFHNIIIDVRENGGGNLDATDSIIQSILPDSTPFIIEKYRAYDHQARQARTINWDTIWTNHGRQLPFLKTKRFVVLANRRSASASEILVAALKDGLSHAPEPTVLVGDTTYGKGMGQIVISREHLGRSDIRITFLRIKGLSDRTGYYHRKGILPDLSVDCDSLENLIADLLRRMNTSPSSRAFYQAEVDTLQRKCDSLNISAALRILEPSAHFHKLRIVQNRNNATVAGKNEAGIIASPDDFPLSGNKL